MVGHHAHGLVELESTDLNFEFTESDLDLLSIVGSMLAAAVERIRLAQQRERTIVQLREAQTKLLQTQDQLVRTESMAAIGRFASGIAHEVKNHLAPFMLADMLARNYPDDQDVQESAELMLEAQRRIVGLVDEIRHFASGGNAEYEMLPYDVVSVIEGVIRFVKCDASLKRMDISFESKGRPLVDMDAGRMRQVFINLIRNAADSIGHQQGKIEILVWESEGGATIQVVDNGAGISQQDQKKIFEPFYTTKGEHGLGLGLDISRKIITAHQGALTFTSGAKGTTFQIVMPLVQDSDQAYLSVDSVGGAK